MGGVREQTESVRAAARSPRDTEETDRELKFAGVRNCVPCAPIRVSKEPQPTFRHRV